jgi:hypothetical protein
MITPSELAALWREVASGPLGTKPYRARRIDRQGAIEVYAAIRNTDGANAVLFRLDARAAPTARFGFRTEGITLCRVPSDDTQFVFVGLVVEDSQVVDQFAVVAADVAAHVADGTIAGAGSRLAERLEKWRRALRARRDGLSPEAMLGLIGELIVLSDLIGPIDQQRAVEAWAGPERGLHDFVVAGTAVEIKTVAGDNTFVTITSLDQLDRASLRRLVLARVRLTEDAGGLSLTDIVARVRMRAPASGELERKLALAGWRDQDVDAYAAFRYRHLGIDLYEVCEAFPALTRAHAPLGVADAIYRLDVRALAPFALGADGFAQVARDLAGEVHDA